jgi:hypothetical protein
MTINVAVVLVIVVRASPTFPFVGVSIPPFIFRRRGYKEGNRVGYNMVLIWTLFLLVYFTYIFIDIIIYVLRSMSWSSRFFGWWTES